VVRSLDETRLVTLLYAVIDLRDWRVHIANAGHLPPLVLAPGGAASFLEVPRGGPLGMVSAEREEVELQLEPGSTLLLYTDGLVQRRGQPLDDGLERLERAAAGLGKGPVPAAICEALAAKLVDHAQSDDAVLLVARLLPPHELLQLELRAVPESLAPMRRELTRWLEAGGVGTGDVGALTLACGEAAANAVEHAYGPDDGTFQMRASRHGDEIAVEIRDRGSWREQRGEDHGRGLILMDALLDSVEVEPGADGTTVLLRKRLGQEQAHGHASVA
jgi:anti-sigma regulatory factor (Ser/Thr protein kinase)